MTAQEIEVWVRNVVSAVRQGQPVEESRVADSVIVLYRVGKLTTNKMAEATAKIVEILTP